MSNSIKKKKVRKHNKICETQAKVLLRGKFISPSSCIGKEEKFQNHDLSSHFENSEKEQNKPKVSKRKEVKIRNRLYIEKRKIKEKNQQNKELVL